MGHPAGRDAFCDGELEICRTVLNDSCGNAGGISCTHLPNFVSVRDDTPGCR